MIGFEFGYWALKYTDLKPKYLGRVPKVLTECLLSLIYNRL